MFCSNCGIKSESGGAFCHNCGLRSASAPDEIKDAPQIATNSEFSFYSCDWSRVNFFAVSSYPYFDILIANDELCIIEMPRGYAATAYTIVGLFFGLIGAAVGASIGQNSDREKRKKYRTAWLGADRKLTSRAYEQRILLRIPINEIKERIVLKGKRKVILHHNNKKITLKRDKEENKRLREYLRI